MLSDDIERALAPLRVALITNCVACGSAAGWGQVELAPGLRLCGDCARAVADAFWPGYTEEDIREARNEGHRDGVEEGRAAAELEAGKSGNREEPY